MDARSATYSINSKTMFFSTTSRLENQSIKMYQAVDLVAKPPLLTSCLDLLKKAGVEHFALFGGAIRDADYVARHHKTKLIKDYDIRVWLPINDYDQHKNRFLKKLTECASNPIKIVPSLGTDKLRYCLFFQDKELDISIRPVPIKFYGKAIPSEAVAIDRIMDSDCGISAVAIDSTGQAWATKEYLSDQINKTLSMYPSDNSERSSNYALRMQQKFSDHILVWLDNSDKLMNNKFIK